MINIQSAIKYGWMMSHRNDRVDNQLVSPESTEEEPDKFRVNTDIEVLYILRSMMKANALVTISFDNEDGFILTSIIGINSKRGELIFDYGTNGIANRRALNASKFNIFTLLDRVEIQFVCQDIEKIKSDGKNAFKVSIPECLLRLQKREHYRINTPVINPLKCMIPLPDGSYAGVLLQNISRGGMAVLGSDREADLVQGAGYSGCLLDLPGVGTVKLNLQVKAISEFTQRSGIKCQKAGLEFATDTEERVLSMIQRYLIKLQMERKRAH